LILQSNPFASAEVGAEAIISDMRATALDPTTEQVNGNWPLCGMTRHPPLTELSHPIISDA
jgi:hypothetical protein